MAAVNYVLCAWSGPRRVRDAKVYEDPTYYLRVHLDALKRQRHTLKQITIVVPHNPTEPPDFRQFIQALPSKIRDADVVVVERPNVGMSYGSFADVYARYRTEFDYYFFVEDDYIFVQHDFDQAHLKLMREDPACGYLCAVASDLGGRFPLHAAVPHGLFRTAALEAVFARRGRIPHGTDATYSRSERDGQIGQSQAIIGAGYRLRDWSGRYRVSFREADFSITHFHDECEHSIIEPIGRRTNYVLCSWSGARRVHDADAVSDPTYYLRVHLDALRTYRHSLNQVTIVAPHNPSESIAYRHFLDTLPSTIQQADLVVMERPNVGLSYGSLSDAYAKYRDSFDYYFFAEDDYVFTRHDFDRSHLQLMEEDQACGYLCGLAWTEGGRRPLHAGMASGCMRGAALEKVFCANGMLPHAGDTGYSSNEASGQVGQSQAIIAQGYTLRDWAGRYRVGFRRVDGTTVVYHENCAEPMILPIGAARLLPPPPAPVVVRPRFVPRFQKAVAPPAVPVDRHPPTGTGRHPAPHSRSVVGYPVAQAVVDPNAAPAITPQAQETVHAQAVEGTRQRYTGRHQPRRPR